MIGALNQRATLLSRTESSDGGGGVEVTWASEASFWVGLSAQAGSEHYGADAMQSCGTYQVLLRRRAAATGQRLQIGSRLFEITGVMDDGPHSALIRLRCEDVS